MRDGEQRATSFGTHVLAAGTIGEVGPIVAVSMLLVPAFLAILLLVRGMPVFVYRHKLAAAQRPPFALSVSTASLALIVVITQFGLRAKNVNPDVAVALIGASLLSLLVYPTLTGVLMARTASSVPGPTGS